MKEELQSKLVEILGSIQAAAGKAGDFALAQLPEIAQQYVAYGRVYSVVMALIGIALVAFAIFMLIAGRRAYGKGEEEYRKKYPGNEYRILYRDNYPMGVGYFALMGGAGLFGVLTLMANMSSAVMVWFAPKVWLLKEIAGMLR